MSALPPIATAKADFRKRSCLLCSRKRTDAAQNEMSATGQLRSYKTKTNWSAGAGVVMWFHLLVLACALLVLPAQALAGAKEKVAALAPSGLVLAMDEKGNE